MVFHRLEPPSTMHRTQPSTHPPYQASVHTALRELADYAQEWDRLRQDSSPFTRFHYLLAMEESGSACAATGWTPQHLALWQTNAAGDKTLCAAAPLYCKNHSYGEYVFDWAWAQAYEQHGLRYYPKLVCAIPFTPVPGQRLLARDAQARRALLQEMVQFAQNPSSYFAASCTAFSSLHLLFLQEEEHRTCTELGLLARSGVQFHWHHAGWESFEAFLASLKRDKRKKIQQEQRKVADAGISFTVREGSEIRSEDWDFFYQCYTQTYLEHGNAPYLSRAFFQAMQRDMPQNWLLFTAHYNGSALVQNRGHDTADNTGNDHTNASARPTLTMSPNIPISPTYQQSTGLPIACSLIALNDSRTVAYGRYWGALARVSGLHFDACYYQPLRWCIDNGIKRFEGGAQGEHKIARALLPTPTTSAHWIADPRFKLAISHFLEREHAGIEQYEAMLQEHSPFKTV